MSFLPVVERRPAGRVGGQDCDESDFKLQAPIGSLPSRTANCVWNKPPSRADRSTQRHSVAGRSKSQTRPNDPTILITVIRVASASHRHPDAGLLAADPERSEPGLASTIRVVDHPIGFALFDGHVQSIGDQRCG